MDKNIERELKILVSKSIYDQILNSYDFNKVIIQTNTYYDTKERSIKNKNGALRLRKIDDQTIFTLKIRKDAYTHYEYEKSINVSSLADIDDEEILSWLSKYEIDLNEVSEITSFTTHRHTYEFENGELCLDHTYFKDHDDHEIEYEYRNDHDGITFFNQILAPYNIQYTKNCSSKIARATDH